MAADRDAMLAERIVREFSTRARAAGPSAVVMAELARDLGISTKTLYRIYPSKATLVHRLIERWTSRFERDLAADAEHPPRPSIDQLINTSEVWQANRRRFGHRFWDEIERDYPDSYAVLVAARSRLRADLLHRLAPELKRGIAPDFAMELFDAMLAHSLEPDVRRRTGVDAATAIRTAVRIWSRGALVAPLEESAPRSTSSASTGRG